MESIRYLEMSSRELAGIVERHLREKKLLMPEDDKMTLNVERADDGFVLKIKITEKV